MYKRNWNKKFGKSEIFKAEDSFCQKVEMDMLKLADGDSKSYREENKEYALVILGGKCMFSTARQHVYTFPQISLLQ